MEWSSIPLVSLSRDQASKYNISQFSNCYKYAESLTLPAYTLLVYPLAFCLGGLLCITEVLGLKRISTFLAGIFTVYLGLFLVFFLKSKFPLVLILAVIAMIGCWITFSSFKGWMSRD